MKRTPPPMELAADIELPDRSGIRTVGDMARIILADEEVVGLKNADLKILRKFMMKGGQ